MFLSRLEYYIFYCLHFAFFIISKLLKIDRYLLFSESSFHLRAASILSWKIKLASTLYNVGTQRGSMPHVHLYTIFMFKQKIAIYLLFFPLSKNVLGTTITGDEAVTSTCHTFFKVHSDEQRTVRVCSTCLNLISPSLVSQLGSACLSFSLTQAR